MYKLIYIIIFIIFLVLFELTIMCIDFFSKSTLKFHFFIKNFNLKPSGLASFSMYQKQERRVDTSRVTFLRYLQIDAYNVSTRLLKRNAITINGSPVTAPFSSGGINIYYHGGKLVYSTDFGLTVNWDGDQVMSLTLCDAYAGYVCGLCGNADGN